MKNVFYLLALLAGLALIIFLLQPPPPPAQAAHILPLAYPSALRGSIIYTPSQAIAAEAGVAAYAQLTCTIAITDTRLRGLFRIIESEAPNYILGWTPAYPGYAAEEDVKVFALSNGWLMTYYLARDPASRMLDHYTSGNPSRETRFDIVLNRFLRTLGCGAVNFYYYDFRYPNATQILLAGDSTDTENTFDVMVPGGITVYERSFVMRRPDASYVSYLYLDGNQIASYSGAAWGFISESVFAPDVYHTFRLKGLKYFGEAFGGAAIVYRDMP